MTLRHGIDRIVSLVSHLPGAALRALLVGLGVVFTLSLVTVAAGFAVLAVAAALLSGKRPVFRVRFGMDPRAGWRRFQRADRAKATAHADDVVDVEAREVAPDAPRVERR